MLADDSWLPVSRARLVVITQMLFQLASSFLLVLCDDFPAHASHAGLETQAAHDLLPVLLGSLTAR